MNQRLRGPRILALGAIAALAAACSTGPTSSVTLASVAPVPTTAAVPTDPTITLTVPAEVGVGKSFTVSWTGAETSGDFLVIVPRGATTWTETPDSPYVNATTGNPATLKAPREAGPYEVWFLKGDTEGQIIVKAKSDLTVK